MEIRIDSLLEGAQRARGTVIIVDVYRAFTTASVALERGISNIIFVAQPEEALAIREQGLADICVGEVFSQILQVRSPFGLFAFFKGIKLIFNK